MDDKQRERENKIDQLHTQLKFVTEDRYNSEASIHQFERNEEEAHSIFHGIHHLFQDIQGTFQEGEMTVFITDAHQEIEYKQQGFNYDNEEKLELLQKEKRELLDSQDELYYKLRSLNQQGVTK